MKVLIVLCLGVIAVQAFPKLHALPVQDVFDDILRELADLNRMVTEERRRAIDTLGGELASLDELSQHNIQKLEEDLLRDSGMLQEQVHDLEREARDYRVDISECIGDRLEQISKLPEHHIGEAGICASEAHRQAEDAVREAYRRIAAEVDPIEEYFGQLERCRERDPRDQDVCVATLLIEIQNDQIQIPSKIRLVVEEVLGHLEAEKPTLLLCVAGRVERLNQEGRELVGQIADCAEHLLPPRPPGPGIKASPAVRDVFDDILRELGELNRMATEEQTRAIDTLAGELRSLDQLSQQLLKQLGEDLVRDSDILEEQVHDLEREARDRHVDISECIGDRLEQISKLLEHHIGEAGICANEAHRQAEETVNGGLRRITSAVDPIEEYFRELERCRERDPRDQEICVASLLIRIQNDQIEIPAIIHLAVGEVLGNLEAEKPTLLLCVAGRVERLNQEGRELVGQIADCAEHLLPPRPPGPGIKASPAVQDVFDDIIRELAELNGIAIQEQTRAIDTLGGELRSLDELSQHLIQQLGEDLARDSGIMAEQVHDLEREARDRRVDISECIGDRLEQLSKLPEHHIGEAGICANEAHRQAEEAVNDGFRRITSEVDPIEEYFRQLERCRERDPRDQDVCVAALLIGIQNDKIQIPSKIHLVVDEVLGHLEAEKPTLLLCVAGRVERLNQEGRELVGQIADCAEHLLPPRPHNLKV